MANRSFMKLFWGDYYADTNHLTDQLHGAYLMLIGHYWSTGKPLNDDDDELWLIARCTSKESWLKIREKIVPFFMAGNGVLVHKRIECELSQAARSYDAKVASSKKAAGARWGLHAPRMQPEPEPESEPERRVQNQREESEPEKNRSLRSLSRVKGTYDPEFEEFWREYPRKIGKPQAAKAYSSAMKRTSGANVLEGVRRYPFSQEEQFRPYPATWLNDDRFNVEAPTAPQTVARDEKPSSVGAVEAMRRHMGLAPKPPINGHPGYGPMTIDGSAEEGGQ